MPGVYDPGELAAIYAQLTRALGHPPMVRRIVLSSRTAQFEVDEAARPDHVDNYRWRAGHFSAPRPVRLSARERRTLASDLFPVRALNLNAPDELVEAGKSLEIDGAHTRSMVVERDLPFSSNIVWLVDVEGRRESRQIRADAAGRILQVL